MGFDLGQFLGSILSSTGLGIGRSGMHPLQGSDIGIAARELGVSPLAMLGGAGSLSGGTGAQVGDPGVAGQMLGRALSAPDAHTEKINKLQEQRLALENENLRNDIVAQNVKNSLQAQSFGAAGSPPTWMAGQQGSPFFGPISPFSGPHATFQVNADGSISRTKEQAEIAFSGDPVAMAQTTLGSFERLFGDKSPTPTDIGNWMVRPDILRILGSGSNLP